MLLEEKADQAHTLLANVALDCWLTFVRETTVTPDPGVDLVVGTDVTWPSAFLLGRDGTRVAIVGRHDVPNVRATGVFQDVVSYDEGIRQPLVDVLNRLNPTQIGLNYSIDDKTADGLTHGMWLMLKDLLRDTPFVDRLTSAAPLLSTLRARKTPNEIERIKAAIATTEEIVALTEAQFRVGVSEAAIGDFVHEQFRSRGLPSAWSWEGCPIVNTGPESAVGHVQPRADLFIAPGHLVHIDLGVQQEGYCSDIQRMWYVLRSDESEPPAEIQHAFATVIAAIDAGAALLKPGVLGYQVDAAARQVIVDNGFDEYKHAFGHSLGRACHDGGPLLGPRWERYGTTPEIPIEAGNVFTLELGVETSAGYIGIEEDVVVTEQGCEYLSTPQRALRLIAP
ncbi:MAG: Xaa-Pro peptidase family protein [Chloroflexota bacterium]